MASAVAGSVCCAVGHGLHVLQHLLQLRQHVAGGVAGAALGQLAGALEHALQVLAVHLHHVRIERALMRPSGLLLHVALHLLGQRGHELVHRLLQLVHQPLDLGVGRAVGERVLQRLLEPAQVALGQRQVAVLDAQGGSHSRRLHAVDGGAGGVEGQPALRHLQAEEHDQIVVVGRRLRADGVEGAGHRRRSSGLAISCLRCSMIARAIGWWNTRSGSTISTTRWCRSGRWRRWRSAGSAPAGRPRDAASDRDSWSPGPCWIGAGHGQRQLDLVDLAGAGLAVRAADAAVTLGQAVVVAGGIGEAQRLALGRSGGVMKAMAGGRSGMIVSGQPAISTPPRVTARRSPARISAFT